MFKIFHIPICCRLFRDTLPYVNQQNFLKIRPIHIFIYFTAPGSYDIEKAEKRVHESSSAYSFGMKYKEQKTDEIPGKIFDIYRISKILLEVLEKFYTS